MDAIMEKIADELRHCGWKRVSPGTIADIPFDLMASRRFLLNKWTVLVRRVAQFDGEAGRQFAVEVKTVTSRYKTLTAASRFIFCVVADHVDPTLKEIIGLEATGLRRVFRMRSGKGRYLVLDRSTREITGRVPTLPYDAHIFMKQLYTILSGTG